MSRRVVAGAGRLGDGRVPGGRPGPQEQRLHLVANHARFLVLASARRPNLASRVWGRSVRRLSPDLQNRHDDPMRRAATL